MLVEDRHDATQIRVRVDVTPRLAERVSVELALDPRRAAAMNEALAQIGRYARSLRSSRANCCTSICPRCGGRKVAFWEPCPRHKYLTNQ